MAAGVRCIHPDGMSSSRWVQRRRINAASPMLTPRLTTPSDALQNALSRVFRNALGSMAVLIESQSARSGPDRENAVRSIDAGC